MGNTARYGWAFPEVTDPPNTSLHLKNLAQAVETTLGQVTTAELEQESTADYTLTTSYADITGASITFNTTVANAVVVINADFDLRTTATGTGYCYGGVVIDGALHARQRLFVFQSAETRAGGHLRIKTTLATVGSHTIKLQGRKDSAGTALFAANTTVLGLTVYGT